ncbi:MAG: thiamine phosphate synthase [Verrucomicrobiales bacterium]|nr:thiamine phosphate synthase [Verrucomicrobiales bacterium]
MRPLADCRLYGILDLGYVARDGLVSMARDMIAGGVDLIQLRAKGHPPDAVEAMGREILPVTRDAGVPFIINDWPQVAAAIGADGVHVGQDDAPMAEVRGIVGPTMIVGRSTHSLDQARAAAAEPADYIGFGPLFATPTKPDYVPIGMDDIRQVHEAHPSLPIFCIGGIKRDNLSTVLAAGARRVVIVSGILQAPDVAAYVRGVRAQLAGS